MDLRAAETPPAAGAAFDEIAIAGAMAGVVILFFGWVILRERAGRPTFVSRLADWSADLVQLPRWVALPSALGLVSVLVAGWGVWWDVPIHMQNGRDEGPLANPSHYPIFLGILGFCHAGLLSMGLARDPLPRHTVRLSRTWRVPLGSLVITGAGLIALVGFPADDLWHRLFGQDVTEWGPTHVMMIGGAVTFVLGIPLLLAEAAQVSAPRTSGFIGRLLGALAITVCGIPFAFLMEFDLGVPQFPAVTQFIIFAFLAAWIGCAVRLWLGPGGALLVGAAFWTAHLFLWATIWALPDVLTARWLLLVPSVVIIEVVAAILQPKRTGREIPFVVVSGVLVGSLGMYGEWLWSKFFMPLPQPFDADTLPFLLGVSTIAGLGGGLMAAWMLSRLVLTGSSAAPPEDRPAPRRWFGLAGLAIFAVLMGVFGVPKAPETYTGVVGFSDVTTGGSECAGTEEKCLATVTIRLDDPDVAEDAVWFYALAWQGRPGGDSTGVPRDPQSDAPGIVRTALEPTGVPGEYRTEHPVPLYGNWKTLLRLHVAPSEMVSFPLYAPDDPAIESSRGRAIVTTDGQQVETVLEREFLQREQREDVPTWAWTVGYIAVIATWLALLLFYGWCYNRAAQPVAPSTTRTKETV
ncbi:hypothetical protein DJ010_06925 [Nocardioides silvaticus]|uniref:Uncharacterized protein n=1 Tax=Nocardioides silvaticus TaxID=2201891 RepID=A0A316TKK2_9ACTN|nr:hypothetical protein [Nocardioides silvaticus]PWN03799.1 hypothetical protein DJ010_06925 [Nocardioides silvaticus]